ncbi:MAG: hypothetical protein ACXACA_01595 [Candidatus Ranarchaeia archaeon]|jgi:hypothetical protein
MVSDFELFIAIAEIAGIFVGFGALISITSKDEFAPPQLARIRGVVTIGLVVIVVALVPIGLNRYGITDHPLWFTSSLIYFLINWAGIIYGFHQAENREFLQSEIRTSPIPTAFFWILLEIPLQAPLILTLLGWYPTLEPAFYTTALLFYLFEGVFILTQLVYTQVETKNTQEGKPTKKSKKMG